MNKKDIRIVKAICAKYNERAAEIERGDKGNPNRVPYVARCAELNNAVDRGLDLCPDAVVRAIVKNSLLDVHHSYVPGLHPIGINQFYALRRAVIEEIAKRLNLIL